MSADAISLAELQDFVGNFWFHYDEAHYGEMAAAFAEDAAYLSRSDSGSCPFEEALAADLSGAAAIIPWLTEHRRASPYPLRHHATNLHITGTEDGVTYARFYIFVNQVTNFVPFAVSSGVTHVGVRRDISAPKGLQFTKMEVILDVTNSEPLAGAGLPGAPDGAAASA
ncbi:polyketide cyclase [Mycobacterium sp. 852013-50091_SCH5140682]|uniref:nuclear transport factor 2 family protein n=1 Tax=Mycobacterium sp. 852013-50091_SCH5140682 TaxID=1834109 RepID=UPI0007EA115B|nr:nuclear transport factor 2 family protein [Mycobacterium sp. 852013-50091_SCH5140682]OBB98833.1 polyketide cyclase [Mycobacterium sp. 852013-50091_SCH5140682]